MGPTTEAPEARTLCMILRTASSRIRWSKAFKRTRMRLPADLFVFAIYRIYRVFWTQSVARLNPYCFLADCDYIEYQAICQGGRLGRKTLRFLSFSVSFLPGTVLSSSRSRGNHKSEIHCLLAITATRTNYRTRKSLIKKDTSISEIWHYHVVSIHVWIDVYLIKPG